MDNQVIEYINKKFNFNIKHDYYKNISNWEAWWQGRSEPFHRYSFNNGVETVYRDMYTLKMAKKVCEDWASILLNEKTNIILSDIAADNFLQAGANSVLERSNFWTQGNKLIEKTFALGTGAIVLRLNNVKLSNNTIVKDSKATVSLSYISAQNIIPLSWSHDEVREVAFSSSVNILGKNYIYLEMHTLVDDKYKISNFYFENCNNILKEATLPKGLAAEIYTGSNIPLFAIIKPNIVNNLDDSAGLGISIFANSIDNLKGVDLAYNNLCCDFKLGGKKVFLNRDLLTKTNDGKYITPDDTNQQLFTYVGDTAIDGQLVHEHNPLIRVAENTLGIQSQLDYLSFKCGLGTKHYQFNSSTITTATQYMGDKQELAQNASKHYIAVERMLKQVVKAVLWAGKNISGVDINEDAEVTIQFDDSIIIDKESERQRDIMEVEKGIMGRYEYRMKWYGESEDKAKASVVTA